MWEVQGNMHLNSLPAVLQCVRVGVGSGRGVETLLRIDVFWYVTVFCI